ncbi:hypothetical protein B0H67DRAFT_647408 [Lasiosphaeris hirsuta]|uniref:Uncharacterized protein n=1 Tax=Lasiosphaeris hirsuta TaxID=260670 RepID=A0AA40AA61_9PEZI|nr:hypothetical protein B0H67DRAFT_647408 [Lasiosphaeris hirsuta]
MLGSDDVYVGLWRNWEKGPWSAYMITISLAQGAILISFITLFVRWVGGRLWNIFAFILHQHRSTTEARDGLYYQQQVLLRNSESASHTLWTLAKLAWRWSGKANGGVLGRCLLLALPAAVNVAGFAAAGLLASRLLDTNDEVLVRGGTCGWLADGELADDRIYADSEKNKQLDSLWVAGLWTMKKSVEYTSACYEGQSTGYSSLCSTYVQSQILSTVDTNSACPLAERACSGPAVHIDSGLIDSSTHLGINSPPGERVSLRKLATCAPFDTDKYQDGWEPYGFPPDPDDSDMLKNSTWKYYSLFDSNSPFDRLSAPRDLMFWTASSGYELSTVPEFDGNQSFVATSPLKPELKAPKADQLLLLLGNLAQYTEAVTDPWFRASSQNDSRGYESLHKNDGAWYPDSVMTGLNCVEQYQFCANDACTDLSGLYTQDPSPLSLSAAQQAVYDVMWKSAWAANCFFITYFLRGDFLLATRLLHPTSISAPVAPDQWVQEVANLHNISMAVLQRRVVEYSRPPDVYIRPGVGTRQFIVAPVTAEEQALCENIKVREPGYRSFSLASLVFILLCGAAIAAVELLLPPLVFRVRAWRGASEKSRAWVGDYVFHLHKTVLESRGVGPWLPTEHEIPVLDHDVRRQSVASGYGPVFNGDDKSRGPSSPGRVC